MGWPIQQKIFLSYSRRNEVIAEALIKAAAARNLSIWYDRLIPAGGDWRDSIVGEIEKCDALVILFSKESSKLFSPTYFVVAVEMPN